MNFKPTLAKALLSLIAALLFGILSFSGAGCADCSYDTIIKMKLQVFLTILFLSLIFIYSIWSLFQKPHNKFWHYFIAILFLVLAEVILFILMGALFSYFI